MTVEEASSIEPARPLVHENLLKFHCDRASRLRKEFVDEPGLLTLPLERYVLANINCPAGDFVAGKMLHQPINDVGPPFPIHG